MNQSQLDQLKAARDKFVSQGIALHVPAVQGFLAELNMFIVEAEAELTK